MRGAPTTQKSSHERGRREQFTNNSVLSVQRTARTHSIYSWERDIAGKEKFDLTTVELPADDAPAPENDQAVPLAIQKDAIIVDTSSIYGTSNFKEALTRLAAVSGRPRRYFAANECGRWHPHTFWEVEGDPFPYELELDFPTARTPCGYILST